MLVILRGGEGDASEASVAEEAIGATLYFAAPAHKPKVEIWVGAALGEGVELIVA